MRLNGSLCRCPRCVFHHCCVVRIRRIVLRTKHQSSYLVPWIRWLPTHEWAIRWIRITVYMYYFKKYEPTKKGFIITGIVSILILGFIFFGLIPQIVKWLGIIERTFVNSIGLPFNSGTIFFIAVLSAAIYYGLKKGKSKWPKSNPYCYSWNYIYSNRVLFFYGINYSI